MQVKLGSHVLVTGNATKDAEIKFVGDRSTPMTTFGMAVGKTQDQQTIYANCKAWRKLAEYAAEIQKGDAVCAIGTIEEREWNGKTYKTLTCEWLNVVGESAAAIPSAPNAFAGAEETQEELPF